MQNLGFFPVKDLQLNIEIPEMTKNGNQLLQISDFYIDQVRVKQGQERNKDQEYRNSIAVTLVIKTWF